MANIRRRLTTLVDSFRKPLPFGVNLAGYLNGEFGVAESARSFARALTHAGVPFVLNGVDAKFHWARAVNFELSEQNPYRFNLIHVNAADVRKFFKRKGHNYRRGHYNIGLWYWEVPEFPKRWRSRFDYFQEIWVTSHFGAEAVAEVSPIPVRRMPYPFSLGEVTISRQRNRFWLPEDSYVFLFNFDFASVVERKNPFALVRAFAKAFNKNDDTVLVIKSLNAHCARQTWLELKQAAEGLKIRLIDEYMERQEFLTLMASSDCYVSLHRSEGLGLGLAEAMSMAKPVIATGWSGNMDFMTAMNSFLVKYQLVKLNEDHSPYRKGSSWADPDIEHAAELMRFVFQNRDAATATGKRAAEELAQNFCPAVTGKEIANRLAEIGKIQKSG
jgi:glycosyltransferase involved in cell wall biosynthesis